MTHAPTRSLRATTAICAVLALGSTAAWAQDTAPPLDTPAVSAPAAPTIELPTETAPPPAPASPSVVSQPVIEQPAQTAAPSATPAEAASAPARAAPTRSSAPRQAARTAAAPVAAVTRSAPAAQAEPAPALQAAEPMPPAASVPLAQPAVAPPPPAPALTDDRTDGPGPVVWIAGILVVLGAGAVGFSALRSHRRRVEVAYDDATWTEPAYAAEPAPPVVVSEPVAPLPAFTAIEEPAVEPFRPAEVAPAAAEERREAFAMPAGPVPQTRAERDALLEEMVAAAPDAENPFTSRKARLRRARIILQSLEHQQKEEATKPFDWRTYEPSTSHPAPATPARVTV